MMKGGHIKIIYLHRAKLLILSKSNENKLKTLTKLNLGYNQIEIIERNTFKGLINLEELILFTNQIKK